VTAHDLQQEFREAVRNARDGETVTVEDEAIRVEAQVERSDGLAARFQKLELRKKGYRRAAVPDVAERAAATTALGERLCVTEAEKDRALVRTEPEDIESGRYHQIDVTEDRMRVERRQRNERGEPAAPCPLELTHEQSGRLVRQLSDAFDA
jgi:hypothetical protein